MYQIITNELGVVIQIAESNLLQADGIEIEDEAIWDDVRSHIGLRRWTGSAIVVYDPPAPAATVADLATERDRRLALGFHYDFTDERGVHLIATAPADMRKWMDEVNPLAQALVNAGQPAGQISIVTETGPVTITAAEWQSILLAAGQWRQPIYAAYFALKALDPIPSDFADNAHWPVN